MGKVYLNDIDIDIFAKYFNKNNYTDTENTLVYENVKIEGPKYPQTINHRYSDGVIKNENITIFSTGNWTNNGSSVSIDELDESDVVVIPRITGIRRKLDIEDDTTPYSLSVAIPYADVSTLNLLDYIEFKFSLETINSYIDENNTDMFSEDNFIEYRLYKTSDNNTKEIIITLEPKITLTNMILRDVSDGSNMKVFKDNLDGTENDTNIAIKNADDIEYTDLSTGSSAKSIDIFGGENSTYLVSVGANGNLASLRDAYNEFIIIIHPYTYTTPRVDDEGNYVYKDANGKYTVVPEYPNKFYSHQKAIRKAFFDLVETNSWQYKVPAEKITLVQRGNKHQFVYYYNAPKNIKYEYITVDDLPNNVSFDSNIPSKNICVNPSAYNTTENIKIPVLEDVVEDYPTFKTYIKKTDKINSSNFKFSYIEGLNEKNFKNFKDKPCVLEVYSRTTKFKYGSTTYDISGNETISIKSAIGITESQLANASVLEYTVNNLNGEIPYILLPITTSKGEVLGTDGIMDLGGSSVFIGDIKGKLEVSGHNLTDVYLRINGEQLPVYTAEEVGYDSSTMLIGLGSDPESESVFFFKIPLTEIETVMSYKVICTLSDYISPIKNLTRLIRSKHATLLKKSLSFLNSKVEILPTTSLKEIRIAPVLDIIPTIKQEPVTPVKVEPSSTTTSTRTISTTAAIGGLSLATSRPFGGAQLMRASLYSLRRTSEEEEDKPITSREYSISDTTISYTYHLNNEEIVTYYKNPYSLDVSKQYIKKTESISAKTSTVKESFGKFIYLHSVDSSLMDTSDALLAHFIKLNRYSEDNMITLRGDIIPDDVFYDRRVRALKDTMTDVMKLYSPNILFPPAINPSIEIYKNNGTDRLYNYCKSILSLIREDYKKPTITKDYSSKVYIDFKNTDERVILQSTKYVEPTEEDSAAIVKSILSASRPFIQRIAEREDFPINAYYNAYITELSKSENIKSRAGEDIVRTNNINIKYYNKNATAKKAYVPNGNSERNMVAGGISNFIKSGSKQFLNFNISSNVLSKAVVDYGIESSTETIPYKKVYMSNKITDTDLENFIKDMTVPVTDGDDKIIMEVTDDIK